MDNNMDSMGFGNWGLVVFLLLIFWFGFGNNGFGRGYNDGGHTCGCVSNCEVEKQGLLNTNEILKGQRLTNEKIDFYGYQDVRDKLAETQRELIVAQERNYSDNKFHALEMQLADIKCHQLRPPEFLPYGGYVAATCGNFNTGCGC